jgi:hypothetical protein
LGLLVSAVSGVACIDGGAGRDAGTLSCKADGDCAKFVNACNHSICAAGVCRSTPVVCDDGESCTEDRCDELRGCVSERKAVDSACLVQRSSECVGSTWHAPDRCDASGVCQDGGIEECAGTADACGQAECVAGEGCVRVPGADGSACVQGGYSDVCVDGVRFLADACRQGVCEDGGSEPCPTRFCALPGCDGEACALSPLGVEIDLAGTWNLLELYEIATGQVESSRIGLALAGDGGVAVQGMVPSTVVSEPTSGSYCAATDGTLHLALRYAAEDERFLAGRVSRGRDFAVLRQVGADGVSILVRNQTQADAERLVGDYRILGIDQLIVGGTTRMDALLGSIALDDVLCVTGGHYRVGSHDDPMLVRTVDLNCFEAQGLNSVIGVVDVSGDLHRLGGVVGPGGDYAVMQRYDLDRQKLHPSLLFLVREGAQPYQLEGSYVTTRVDLDGELADTTAGSLTVTSEGVVSALSEGALTLGPDDLARMTVSKTPPIGGLREDVSVAETARRRLGHLGFVTAGRVDWFADVGGSPGEGDMLGPVVGTSLRVGVRNP